MPAPKHIVIDARIRRASTGRPLDRLVEELQNIDSINRYTILVQSDDDWQMRAKNFATLPCPFPQFSFNPLHEIRFAWLLYLLRPDLVHFGMTQQPLLYFGNIVTMTHDLTMFNFVRRGSTPAPIFWLKMRLYHFMFWWAHKKSKKIIVPTKTVAKELAAFQPFTKRKTVVIYEGGGLSSKARSTRPKHVTGEFIMYTGTTFPHKNLRTLIEAFDMLHKQRPALSLVLVGKRDEQSKELESWARSRPSFPKVTFTGFIPDGELRWLYEHTRAYVFTSLSEGWGLPPLEAMANGAPVVSSDASVMPEVYGTAAHYCNARDPEDVAAKIGEVLDDKKLRQKLIAAGHKQVAKYSWRKMAEKTLEIYRALVKY